MDASTLAKMLKGQRPLGARAITRMGGRLGLGPERVREFTLASPRKNARTSAVIEKDSHAIPSPPYRRIEQDAFAIISDWYHYALLELMSLPQFVGSPAWIARALGISVAEAAIATERLLANGLIEILPSGKWSDRTGGYSTTLGNDFTSVAFRNLQKQILDQAIIALEEVPPERRSQTSMTMAICPDRIPAAKEMIIDFQRRLNAFLCDGPKRSDHEVYHLSLSLYPVNPKSKSPLCPD